MEFIVLNQANKHLVSVYEKHIIDILLTSFNNTDYVYNDKFCSESVLKESFICWIIALKDDVVVGCCLLNKDFNRCVYMNNFAIKHDHQKNSIGRKLFEYLCHLQKTFWWLVHINNEGANNFYQRLGYKVCYKGITNGGSYANVYEHK